MPRRFRWEYGRGRFLWWCTYDDASDEIGTDGRWHALTERGIRRKLARHIFRMRRRDNESSRVASFVCVRRDARRSASRRTSA